MISVKESGFAEAVDEVEKAIAEGVTEEVRRGTDWLKTDLRKQAEFSGLGPKIGNAWRSKVYPARGNSIDPAGWVWSKAPKIVEAFDANPTIVPVNGARYLAIPTDNVPRRGRYNRRMTPREVEKDYRQPLIFRRNRKGTLLAFVKVATANTAKGFSVASSRLSARNAQIRMVLMFVLLRAVRLGKRIDIDSAVNYASDMIVTGINRRFS